MSRLRVVFRLFVISCFSVNIAFAGSATGSSANSTGSGGVPVAAGPSQAAVVSSFAVSPTLAAPGQFVNFSWTTANVTAFDVTPSIAQDDQVLPRSAAAYSYNTNGLAQTTTFRAIAGSGTTASTPVTATLVIVPVKLSASSTAIPAGQSVTLSYSGPNNDSTWVLNSSNSDNPVSLPHGCSGNTCSGTYQTGPLAATTRFSVSLTGPSPTGGQAYSPRVVINVLQPTTLSFKAQSPVAHAGDAVALSWTSTNAASITIDNGIGQLQPVGGGSYCCVHPTQTTTYTATAKPIYPGAPPVVATTMVTVPTGGLSSLKHIIFLVQENRSFDNYFGQLAEYRVNHNPPIQGAQLSDVNDLHTLPPDFQLCNPNSLCFPLYHARTECTENLSPAWDEAHYDMHLSNWDWLHVSQDSVFLMDLFLYTNWSNGVGGMYDTQKTRPLGYYDQTDLPFYYELATQFTADDAWYSPIAANTVPNRMYLFAGTSYGHAFAPANQNDPAWQQPTIFGALTNAGVTWRYYYQDNSVFLAQWSDWNNPKIQGNVRSIQEYYNDLASPNADQLLPQVVFIERASQLDLDEHPLNNVQTGAAAVANMLSALFNSAAWPDSAFILTYDEGGGLYDHQPPILVTPPDSLTEPTDLQQGDIQAYFNTTGFRVPVVVVSPWSRPQTVIHLATDYTSILKLIEDRFNMPPLTQRDATTQDMADPQNGFFDFSFPNMLQVPPLPTQPTNGVCDQRFSGYKNVQIYH
jgi:phospholipase C